MSKTYGKRSLISNDTRGKIANPRDISERLNIIEKRERIGDYEGDTVIGKGHQGVLVTFVDRTTRETKIKALLNCKVDNVAVACIRMLKGDIPLSILLIMEKSL